MAKLIFRYDQAGGVEIDGQGFKGNSCEAATKKFLLARRDAKVVSDKRKPEFFQQATSGVTQKN